MPPVLERQIEGPYPTQLRYRDPAVPRLYLISLLSHTNQTSQFVVAKQLVGSGLHLKPHSAGLLLRDGSCDRDCRIF